MSRTAFYAFLNENLEAVVRSGPSGTDVTLASNAGAIAGAKARKVLCAPMYLGEAGPMRITFHGLKATTAAMNIQASQFMWQLWSDGWRPFPAALPKRPTDDRPPTSTPYWAPDNVEKGAHLVESSEKDPADGFTKISKGPSLKGI
jgi:hypothetical protein